MAGVTYELYSVPTFPTRRPESVDGSEIGSSKRPVRPGDVLVCKINPRINRVWLVADPLEPGCEQLASTEYLVLRTPDPDLSRYLMWYLQSPRFRDWIKLSVEGATGSHTRAKSGPILKQRVQLPPLSEQRRIVAVIEEQLSRLDAADASLAQAGLRLAQLRRVASTDPFEGDWPMKPLSEVNDSERPIRYGILMPKEDVVDGVLYVRVRDYPRDTIVLHGLRRTSHEIAAKYKRSTLRVGDLLLAIRGTYGRVAIVPSELDGGNITQDTARIAPLPSMDTRYVASYLRSDRAQRYFRSVARGVAVKGVNIGDLRVMPIPVPPLEEQRRIVAEVEEHLSVIDAMRASIERAERRSATLRRAILERAFRGELVPQDPSDEPASVLLDRIRAERKIADATPRRRRVKA
ncbi:MAG: restriction endonuclease subunit S [Actinobacteria bacterium]|nr:restriction endonuclease subunit S [Actinomycetota bacterium]